MDVHREYFSLSLKLYMIWIQFTLQQAKSNESLPVTVIDGILNGLMWNRKLLGDFLTKFIFCWVKFRSMDPAYFGVTQWSFWFKIKQIYKYI